jgi:Zn finger protein HypA/HybF involved in hydrogenase expression
MNFKCKNCEKEFELFNSEFCCMECSNDYYLKGHSKYQITKSDS